MDKVKIDQPMPEQNKCPQCGTPLPSGALAGLCPACLLKMGAAADTATDAKQSPFNPPSVAELAPLFPQLEIIELIGKGGMGAVYKARQIQLDRIVALKILPPGIGHDAAFAERFAREAKALAKLNHPNIVTLYEFGAARGQFYFLMEFVDGVNLRQLLQAGRISPREALAIVPQICDALQFAHDQGIVHRDIKPENILLDRRGRVKVADFGLAKIVVGQASSLSSPISDLPVSSDRQDACPTTDAGKAMGTPNYMSPEQIAAPGEVDHRADIYALGVVFYQMLTGELPGKKIAPPSTKVQMDVRLDEIVLRALEKNPELRYQQVSEVKTCVETIIGSSGRESAHSEKSESENQKAEMEPRFSRTAIVGACLALLFILPVVVMPFLASLVKHSEPATRMLFLMPLSLLGFPELLGTTILGWIAVAQIRRSAGKLCGVWLAVFDGLLFPLLLLDTLLGGFWIFILKVVVDPYHQMTPIWALLVFITIVGVDFLIIRWVWRAVNKSVAAPAPPVQKPDRFWRWFAVAVFAMISIPILISIFGLLAAIAIPNFVRARAQSQANAQHTAQMLAEKNLYSDSASSSYIGQTNFPQGDSIEITSVERNKNQMTVKGHYNLVSHDSALLALYITTTNPAVTTTDQKQEMHISKGGGDFELTHPHLVPGLPHVSMYPTNGEPFASLYFGTKAEAAEESKASWITNVPAPAETWSPVLAPGEKPDLQKIRDDMKTLMEQNDYEGALQRQIWYFNHALEYGESNPVRLSFGIMNWGELGRRYPKAKQALLEIRDREVREFSEGRGYAELFLEIQSLNRELHDDDETLALFKTIYQQDKQLASQCYYYVQDSLMQNGDYDLCLKCIGDPQMRFESARGAFEVQKENQERMAEMWKKYPMPAPHFPAGAFAPPDMGQMATNNFVGQICRLVEILVATGHKADAEKIRDEAMGVLDDARLKSAVDDMERRFQNPKTSINPDTGLPAASGGTAKINPATGLPVSSGQIGIIDPNTGLPATEPDDLREARAHLAELRVDYVDSHPIIQRQLARIKELERLTKEEPNDSPELREAKAHLAELRVDFVEQNPEVQKALARIKALEQK